MPKTVKLVVGSGAGGGLVSWAFTIITGAGATFGLDIWAALPLCVILGAAAALVAVYVVTPTDIRQTGRLIAYAMLCGFLWNPVLDAGRLVINQRIEVNQTAAQLKANVDQLKLTPETPTSIGAKAGEAASQAAELLRTTDRLENPKLEEQAATQAAEAVNVIAEKATANPAAATQALNEIMIAAEDSNNGDLAQVATQKMEIIKKNFPRNTEPISPPIPR